MRNQMEAYAVIETGGKQYRVQKDDVVAVELLDGVEAGQAVEFGRVLAVNDGSGLKVGKPVVEGVKATAKVLEHGKGKKVIVFKYKPKKNIRKKRGHRQPFTKVEITAIG